MFTGIVHGMATVTELERKERALKVMVELDEHTLGLMRGASVALAGVCLTAVTINASSVTFDLMGETLNKTTLGALQLGERVNVERSARIGDEIGGHLISGHIAGVIVISALENPVDNHVLTLTCNPSWMPYLLHKGFVALDGCSLTIVDVGSDWFTVHLVPETLARTSFGYKQVGALVNLEIDAMTRALVDTVTTYLSQNAYHSLR